MLSISLYQTVKNPEFPDEEPVPPGGEGEEMNELGRRCGGSYCPDVPLRYLGGLVQHEPHVHVILWGSNWNEAANSAAKTDILSMFEGLSGTAYQEILTQYFDPSGRISTNVSVDSLH